ncbi:MAG: ATP-binding protein [Kiritimatiellia bacterium]
MAISIVCEKLRKEISRHKHTAEVLADSERRYRRLFEAAEDGILILDAETGMVVDVNPIMIKLLGLTREVFLGKKVWELGCFKDLVANEANFVELQRKGYVRYEDMALEGFDGKRHEVEFVSNVYLVDHHKVIQCNIRDITARKQVEKRERLAHAVLQRLNQAGNPADMICDIIPLIKEATGFDAVGIRLRDGDDFPYYSQTGFAEDFLKTENTLVVRDADGGVCRNKDGSICLECTCGLVLSGKTDPANPLFTKDGSAWTNNSLPLLDIPADQDARLHPRNRCVHDGYLSVALIPLRDGDEIIGLLQLNARSANQLSAEVVNFFTGLAASIAIALKRALMNKENAKLQAQLIQSQKMDAIGRLAGGVAHDFNNMLMVIMGNVELCKMNLDAAHPLHKWLAQINKGAQHATTLTRQLLTFARKQVIAPEILDINTTIADMLKLLPRLIGEDIAFVWRPGAVLGLVNMDPSQIDQILTNLAGNSRDAINGTGTITIETANATIDPAYCDQHPGATPGKYVLLAFSDTGCGMDRETMSKVFEPFFTTKEVGKGTGLGLATVYGIVKQNNGYIEVSSVLGQGTQFKIYLPFAIDQCVPPVKDEKPEAAVGGMETILLAEDEEPVRAITQALLVSLGYTVLVADSPETALRLAVEHPGEIHLLLTDVIMPGTNGRDLSLRLAEIRPAMKSLFVSGFSAAVLFKRGIFPDGVNFLPKPFSRDGLARKVSEVLSQKPVVGGVGIS